MESKLYQAMSVANHQEQQFQIVNPLHGLQALRSLSILGTTSWEHYEHLSVYKTDNFNKMYKFLERQITKVYIRTDSLDSLISPKQGKFTDKNLLTK